MKHANEQQIELLLMEINGAARHVEGLAEKHRAAIRDRDRLISRAFEMADQAGHQISRSRIARAAGVTRALVYKAHDNFQRGR